MDSNDAGKKSITRAEYVQLLGLKGLAIKHNDWLTEIADSVKGILAIAPDSYGGHADDLVFDNNRGVDEALRRLGVTVIDEEEKEVAPDAS